MTHHISAMISAHPNGTSGLDGEKLAECIPACFECSQEHRRCRQAARRSSRRAKRRGNLGPW